MQEKEILQQLPKTTLIAKKPPKRTKKICMEGSINNNNRREEIFQTLTPEKSFSGLRGGSLGGRRRRLQRKSRVLS